MSRVRSLYYVIVNLCIFTLKSVTCGGGAQTDQRFVSEARATETMPVILMSDCAGLEPLKELCRCELGLRHNEDMI